MSDSVKNMFIMVLKTLAGNWSVNQFRESFYDYYLENVSDDDLSSAEVEFFSSIQEKLDWVDEDPNRESRDVGWIDNAQFINWLSEQTSKLETK